MEPESLKTLLDLELAASRPHELAQKNLHDLQLECLPREVRRLWKSDSTVVRHSGRGMVWREFDDEKKLISAARRTKM
jgi:hypothetical protein